MTYQGFNQDFEVNLGCFYLGLNIDAVFNVFFVILLFEF